jgi:hypothetical protein
MRIKLTFFLLIINVVLFGFIAYKHHSSTASAAVFLDILGQDVGVLYDVDKIILKSVEWGDVRVLERKNQDWLITEPIQWKANPFVVERILGQLAFLEYDTVLLVDDLYAAGQSLADYGLDAPLLSLRLSGGEKSIELLFGQLDKSQDFIYCLGGNQDAIFVLDKKVLDHFLVDMDLVRHVQIFNIPSFEVNHVALRFGTHSLSNVNLVHLAGNWRFEAPIQVEADRGAVSAFLNRLYHASVLGFIEEGSVGADVMGLNEPLFKLTIEGLERREVLLIGKRVEGTDQYYARLEHLKTVFLLPEWIVIALSDLFKNLRTQVVYPEALDDVTQIVIEDNDCAFSLIRLETGIWQVKQENQVLFDADALVMQSLLESIRYFQIIDFVSDAPSSDDLEKWGLQDPKRKLRIQSVDKEWMACIGNSDLDKTISYLKRLDSPSVYTVDSGLIDIIFQPPLGYKDRLVKIVPDLAKITRLKLSNLKTEAIYFDYRQSEMDNLEGELRPMEPWVDALKFFRVKNFIDKPFDLLSVPLAEGNDWLYVLDIHYVMGDQLTSIAKQLYFSDRASGQLQLGGDPQLGLVFDLSHNWIDLLENAIRPMNIP